MIDIVNGLEICANCCLDLYLNHFNHLNCCILWPINSSSVVIKSIIYQFLVASPEIQTCSLNVWSSPTNPLLRSGFRFCRFLGQDVAPWPLGISINPSCSEKTLIPTISMAISMVITTINPSYILLLNQL